MKEIVDFIVKNKYIIICVSIVVILYALGVIEILSKLIILLFLVIIAVFVGKKMQENEDFLKNCFDFIKNKTYKRDVYYYQKKDDE